MAQSIIEIKDLLEGNFGENISLEPLGCGVEIYVSKNHTFGTDAVLLSNFANPKKSDRAVDLGTGCGIIPLLWLRDKAVASAVGLEISPEAVALANAFECGVNDLPLSMILSWYEQKAVCILLTLLHLGIKNICLGPTLPAFVSPNVLKILVEKFNIAPITTPEEDIKAILG